MHKLVNNEKEFTNQKDILEEVKVFYENMYTEKNVDTEKMKTMSKNIKVKLNEEKKSIEGWLVGCFCCFTSQVNSYGHCGTVSSPNHTFSWAGLNKRLTSNLCTYFRL